jgi:hypothetical protein
MYLLWKTEFSGSSRKPHFVLRLFCIANYSRFSITSGMDWCRVHPHEFGHDVLHRFDLVSTFDLRLCYRLRYTPHTDIRTHNGPTQRYSSHSKYTTQRSFAPLTITATYIFISSTQIRLPQIHLTLSLTLL